MAATADATRGGLLESLLPTRKNIHVALLTVGIISSLSTAGVILTYQRFGRKTKRADLERSARRAAQRGSERAALPQPDDDASIDQQSTDGGQPKYLAALAASHNYAYLGNAAPGSVAYRRSPLRKPPSLLSSRGGLASPEPYDESLIREQLSRNYSFLGDDAMKALRQSFVIVVGAGGVGSWAALMLLRSGVGKLRLIDFDQVSLSSLNRHACATLPDVGRPKVVVCREHFGSIAPWASIEAWVEIFRKDEASRLLGPMRVKEPTRNGRITSQPPTYVIDAIDNIDTKVDLLAYCWRNRIKVFSSMGAGAKSDPSAVQVAYLGSTREDPLSRSVRRRLKLMGIPGLRENYDEAKPAEWKEEERRDQERQAAAKRAADREKERKRRERIEKRDEAARAAARSQATAPPPPPPTAQSSSEFNSGAAGSTGPTQVGGEEARRPARSSAPPPTTWQGGNGGSSSPMRNSSGPQGPAGMTHSRRASSASSFGSGVFHTPLSTPTPTDEEEAATSDIEGYQLPPADSSLAPGGSVQDDGPPPLPPTHGESGEPSSPPAEISGRHLSASKASNDPPLTRHASNSTLRMAPSPSKGSLTPSGSRMAMMDSPSTPSTPIRTQHRQHATSGASDTSERAAGRSGGARQKQRTDSSSTATSTMAHTIPATQTTGPPPLQPDIPCVYSTEKSDTRLLPLSPEEFERGNVEELAALEDFRVRILPVLGPLPAIFGLTAATYVLCDIAGRPQEPLAQLPNLRAFEKMFKETEITERKYPSAAGLALLEAAMSAKAPTAATKTGGAKARSGGDKAASAAPPPPTMADAPRVSPFLPEDVEYLFNEVYRQRSVVPPHSTLTVANARLVRWDSTLPLSYANVALLSRNEASRHEREVLRLGRSPWEVWGAEAGRNFTRRMAEEKRMRALR